MVMLELLKQSGTDGSKPVVDIPAVIRLLLNQDRVIDWDDADDTLDFLDNTYREDLDLLIKTAQDQEASIDARIYALEAIQRIESEHHKVVIILVSLLADREDLILGQVISALRCSAIEDYDIVVPVLIRIVKDWQSTINTKISACLTLVHLVGARKAMRSLF